MGQPPPYVSYSLSESQLKRRGSGFGFRLSILT